MRGDDGDHPALPGQGKRLLVAARIVLADAGERLILVTEKDGLQVLVSVKWQQVAGTAEQKVPFEVICLLDAVQNGPYAKAYLVLGGEGWKLREFYVEGGLNRFLQSAEHVEIMTLEGFVARANQGQL